MTEQEELKQFAEECFREALKYMTESKLQKALTAGLRAKDTYAKINDRRNEADITNVLSLIYEELGNDPLALQFQLDALDIALDENAYDIAAEQYNNLGSKLLNAKAYERALYYFEQTIETSKKAQEANLYQDIVLYSLHIVVQMNMAIAYCKLGNIEQAKKHYELSKEYLPQVSSKGLLFSYLAFEALFFVRIGEPEKADQFVDPLMEGLEGTPYTSDYLEVILDVIEFFEKKGDIERWEKVLKTLEERQGDDSGIQMRLETLNQWLIFYKATGKTDEYREACVKYYELSLEKAQLDAEREANSIELSAEMRTAIREKREADTLINMDPLTGIGNRNKMLADSALLIENSVSTRAPIAIGLLDIDFFKESNDTYGHTEGDKCLKAVAKIIQENIGDNGSVYRYGGDEFLVLMTTNDVDFINGIGKKIKDSLKVARIPNERSPICPYVTISQGYTLAIAEPGDSIDSLVKLADRVLYSVKRLGRNDYKYMSLAEIVRDM